MTDHKFTDERIIRCLNECYGKSTAVAHIVDQGEDKIVTLGRLLDIINRQRAEIEYLEKIKENSLKIIEIGEKQILEIGASWIKEFAERLKGIYINDNRYDHPNAHTLIIKLFYNIDYLVKEMTEENAHEMQSTDRS